MAKLDKEELKKVNGGYVVEDHDENGKRIWCVISLATDTVAGTFDNKVDAIKYDLEVNKDFY